jgi:hypothetical protein
MYSLSSILIFWRQKIRKQFPPTGEEDTKSKTKFALFQDRLTHGLWSWECEVGASIPVLPALRVSVTLATTLALAVTV